MISEHPRKQYSIAFLNSDAVEIALCRPEAGVLEVQIGAVAVGRAQTLRVMVGDQLVHEGAVSERS